MKAACPGCRAVFAVGPSNAGLTAKCPKCQTLYKVPAAECRTLPPPRDITRFMGKR